MIANLMEQSKTECSMYTDGRYNLCLFTQEPLAETDSILIWLFRVLHFLGAPDGFQVNWWKFKADRVLQPGQFPTRTEVNGGWTYKGFNQIYMFRDEEWDRVMIHECIHAFNWDAHIVPSTQVCLEAELRGGTLKPAIFEAATELNAEWLWCIIHSPEHDDMAETWKKQMDWQKRQCLVILERKGDTPWNEDTSVFAYYILKTVLAETMDEFLIEWLSGQLHSQEWCTAWSIHKPEYMRKAALLQLSHVPISMRMTNPEIA